MKRRSIGEIARFLSKTRETVSKKCMDIPEHPGPKGAKLFDVDQAMSAIYGSGEKGAEISPAEASRRLTMKREAEIDLNMEVTRRDRIPLDVVNSVMDESEIGIAGVLKANVGKVLTNELLDDMLSQLRDVGPKLKQWMNSR